MSRDCDMYEKAQRLLAENRVHLMRRHTNGALVCGDSGLYEVWCDADGIYCECYGGSGQPRCSHALAAMALWWDRDHPDADHAADTPAPVAAAVDVDVLAVAGVW